MDGSARESLDSINLFTFILSAIISTPRLFLHVFMGAKLFELMNRDIRLHQDTATKIQNAISLAVGLIVGASSSWLIWRETKRILQLNEPTWDGSYGDQGMDEDQQRFLEDNV
ncbi:Tlg2-vesicle protein [Malassezia psittaci]|uniref:Tlg2-vesicle protein n=1 Tax=Malassezia psittaci TaxID=1821823 RepID=A0AAF0F970_9BASI|nr:Tlg2-vesicle protein [Malassezia psittaci]